MTRVTRSPVAEVIIARPVRKSSGSLLKIAVLPEYLLNILFHLNLPVAVERNQLMQVELRKSSRGDLLDASVRILNQIIQPFFKIDGRQGGYFQHRLVAAVDTEISETGVPLIACK